MSRPDSAGFQRRYARQRVKTVRKDIDEVGFRTLFQEIRIKERERGSGESAALNLTIDDLHGGDVSQDAVSPKVVARGAGTVGLCGGGGGVEGGGTTCHGTPHTTVPPRYTRPVSQC